MVGLGYLIDQIERLPSRIARKGTEVENSHSTFDIKAAELKALKAKRALEIKANKVELPVALLEHHVTQDLAVYRKQMECIDYEAVYKKLEVERKELDDMLMSYKVIARIKMSEMKGGL